MPKHYLGKCDEERPGVKNCDAYINWEFKDGRFSATAEIWQSNKRDIIVGGQCLDYVCEKFPDDEKAQRILKVWKEWHLNDMKAGSPRQEAELKKHKFPGYPKDHLTWACEILESAGLNPDTEYLRNDKPYKYGTAWLREDLPSDIEKEILSW